MDELDFILPSAGPAKETKVNTLLSPNDLVREAEAVGWVAAMGGGRMFARFGSLGLVLTSLLGVLVLPPAIGPTFARLSRMHPEAHRCYGLGNRVMRVTATAYSVGDGMTPGDEVALGGKVWTGTVAVSHDLATLLGRDVCLAGWKYKVRDVMAPEWTRRMDIYMDTPEMARVWGVRELEVRY